MGLKKCSVWLKIKGDSYLNDPRQVMVHKTANSLDMLRLRILLEWNKTKKWYILFCYVLLLFESDKQKYFSKKEIPNYFQFDRLTISLCFVELEVLRGFKESSDTPSTQCTYAHTWTKMQIIQASWSPFKDQPRTSNWDVLNFPHFLSTFENSNYFRGLNE